MSYVYFGVAGSGGDPYQVPSLACQVAKLPSCWVLIKNLATWCQVAKLPSFFDLVPSCQVFLSLSKISKLGICQVFQKYAKMNSAEKKEILSLVKDKWSEINADFSDKGSDRHTRENAWKEILEAE
ncbi:hypothetical protein DdX_15243 [Ditylenchus destructor]|uniref:Uncharacterized protein n=1 Tax=Ditylenchus destructor TaxID=166010 RepID=A0AAD4MSV1_9BILA|nr:hypothetical protein DdX_15243 [Ditylenchus destructor]